MDQDRRMNPVVKLDYCNFVMPSKHTFTIKPIKELLIEEMSDYNDTRWIDPFSGYNSPAHITNDINPNIPAAFHMDALEFLDMLCAKHAKDPKLLIPFAGALLDWPYSLNQYRTCYHEAGMPVNKAVYNARYQSQVKDRLAQLIKLGGKCISFGWNSMGLGKGRGFEKTRILLVAHGRMHNDTIVTVEKKQK